MQHACAYHNLEGSLKGAFTDAVTCFCDRDCVPIPVALKQHKETMLTSTQQGEGINPARSPQG